MSGLVAVVPAKDLAQAKARLAGLLSPEERRGLARAMLADVLAALAAVPDLAGVMVVTSDAELAALAHGAGARLLSDLRQEGPSGAIALAASRLSEDGAAGMLAVPADVPLATPAEFAEVLAAAHAAPAAVLVPALADMGTNAIALRPADAIPPCYGRESFFRHQEAALQRGIEPRILRLPGLGLDVDRPADLAAFAARPSPTRSYAYLADCGIIARLAALPAADADAGRDEKKG